MAKKMMWFGNDEHMEWVPCPKIEMTSSTAHYVVETDFLNGGAAVRRSATGSRRYEMEWNLMDEGTLDTIESFWEGAWGPGPFYFLDPQAMQTNIFPTSWAQPRVALDDGPKLVFDQKPTRAVAAPGFVGSPGVGAQYRSTDSWQPQLLTVPVPEDHVFRFRAHQVTSGASLMYHVVGTPSTQPVNYHSITGGPGGSKVEFTFMGSGVVQLFALRGTITPPGEPLPALNTERFITGKGATACEFVEYNKYTYSAAMNKVGASAVLREVGAWV